MAIFPIKLFMKKGISNSKKEEENIWIIWVDLRCNIINQIIVRIPKNDYERLLEFILTFIDIPHVFIIVYRLKAISRFHSNVCGFDVLKILPMK